MKTVVAAILLGLFSTAAFSADLLPLKHGAYVDKKVPCSNAGNANSILFRGPGFHVSQTLEDDKVLSHRGDTFRLEVKMSDASDILHPKPMGTDRETVVILSSTSFTLTAKYGSASYRWCSAAQAVQ